jgi:HEAT repeat protein
VRYWSALVLAEENATDAVPAISEALQSEKVPETKGNIALALAQLGDPKGLATLQNMCRNINIPATVRVYTAMYTFEFSNQSCLGSLLEIIPSTADSGTRALALAQLQRFGKVSEDDSKRIDAVTMLALKDSSPEVRLAASAAVSHLATPALTLALENSIATESDEGVKSLMLRDLKKLQNNTHP